MAKEYLNQLKFNVIQELPEFAGITNEAAYQQRLNDFKYEVARETGIPLKQGYNGDLKSREAGGNRRTYGRQNRWSHGQGNDQGLRGVAGLNLFFK